MQLCLALGRGGIDEVAFRQTRRQLERRPGDGDVVVVGELAKHLDRRVADGRKMVRELGARLDLDLVDVQPEHVIKEVDLRVVVAAGAVQKESRDALERLNPFLGRAVLNEFFQFGDQREVGTHPQIRQLRRIARCPRETIDRESE